MGTECQFTARFEDGFRRKLFKLSSSCIVGDKEDQVMPATCAESTQQECPCHCSDGFVTDSELQVESLLSCISKTKSTLAVRVCN